jgi:hypothetical protein
VCVPQSGETPSVVEPQPASGSGPSPVLSARDLAFLHVPVAAPQAASEDSASVPHVEVPVEAESTEGACIETPAGPLDALLYPTNADGLVQIGAIVLALWLVSLFGAFIAPILRPYGGVLVLILRVMVIGYLIFYTSYCVFDSSRGGRRVPPVSLAPTPDRGEVLSQVLLLLASTAISFWPAAVCYGLTGQVGTGCALLAVACAFFWPMALLMAVLFDGIDALNPWLIVRSIAVTLPAYLLLAVQLGLLAVLAIVVRQVSAYLPMARLLSNALCLYLLFVGTHLLGRHHWRHRAKLDWGL